ADAVATRLQDAEAKVVLPADGTTGRGKVVPMKETAGQAADASPSVRHVVVWARLGRSGIAWEEGRDVRWNDLIDRHPATFDTRRLDPEHPLFIAYTS